MADKKEESKSEGKKLPMGMILQLLFAIVNLSITGLGAFWVYSATIGYHSPSISEEQLEAEKEKEDHALAVSGESGPLVYTMDKFTVNLAGEPMRTIRVEVNLEMLGKEGFEEIIDNETRAKARDQIVRILSEKSYSDLESIQGKLFLKDRIATDLNGLLTQGTVKDVYFSEFVVQ